MIMRPLAAATRAAIAGSKGGSSQARKPVEAPDSLHSTDYARILDLISEGEIVGLVNGLQSVFLDETPVANGDGSLNFKNVQIDTRVGTQDQDYIKGFPAVESELGVNLELQYGTPWTRAINNTSLSAIRVRLSVPTLSKADTSNGDIKGHSVQYAIDLSTDGGSFVTVLNSAFTGKTSTKYVRSHRIDLPAASSGWIVRVRRLTAQANSGSVADLTFVESFAEILDGKFRYPNSALAAVVVDASQFQNIPTRAYHIRGRIVQVPSNYNPTTRAYTGIWDGTFQPAWTNNPAWVYYDLATNPRYGLGHLVQASQVDKWALYKIARYCDELVSNGAGGQEPRFTCNVYLQTRVDAFKLLQDLASIFRGISFWTGATIKAVADMPEDPVYIYTAANVIDGKFLYQGSGKKARHTVAMVSWNDPADFGRAKVEPVIFEEGIARYGINQTDIIAFGCTSKSQAQRAGRWLLFTEHMETNTVTFSVGLEGTVAQPGQVVLVADPARAGRRIGGRVSLATDSAITVDAAPTVAPGDTISCVLPEAVAQERTVQSVVGRVITTTTPFTDIPVVGAVWTVQSETLAAQKFRVISVTENEGMTYTLTAIQHAEGKFDAVENGVYVEAAPTTILPPSVQLPPTGITITHREVAGEITAQVVVNVDWQAIPSAIVYDVEWRQGQGEWITAGRVAGTSVDVPNVLPGTFEARITAINSLGIKSSPVKSATYSVPDQTVAPDGLITPGKLGGSGVNILPDQYSTYESATLPPITNPLGLALGRNGAVKVVAGSLIIGGAGSVYLGAGLGNLKLTPGKRYIVSGSLRKAVTGNQARFFIETSGASYYYTPNFNITAAGTFQRFSAIIDTSTNTQTDAWLGIQNMAAGDLYVDGLMVEEAIGTLNQPSTYTRGTASGIALSALIAAQAAQATADGQIDIYRQATAPAIGGAGAKLGDYWQDSDDGRWYYCNGSSWVESPDNRLPQAIIDAAAAQSAANTAQGTANARIRLFVQDAQPTGGTYIVGDMWYRPSFKDTKYFNGTGWSLQTEDVSSASDTLVLNPSFEQADLHWTLEGGWYSEINPVALNGQRILVRTVSGSGAGVPNARVVNEKGFSVFPGQVLNIVGSAGRWLNAANGNLYIGFVFYDKDGVYLGDKMVDYYSASGQAAVANAYWRTMQKKITVPYRAVRAHVNVLALGHTDGFWVVDNVRASFADEGPRAVSNGENFIPNSNFGQNNAGFPINVTTQPYDKQFVLDGWVVDTLGGNYPASGAVSVGPEHYGAGNQQQQLFIGDGGGIAHPGYNMVYIRTQDKFSVEPGEKLILVSEGVVDQGTPRPPGLDISTYAGLNFYDKLGNDMGYDGRNVVNYLGYWRSEYTITIPAGVAYVRGIVGVLWLNTTGANLAVPWATAHTRFRQLTCRRQTTLDQAYITDGTTYGRTANVDLAMDAGVRRIGLNVRGSRVILGGARNSRASLVAGIASVRNTTALTANSSGQVTVNAHSTNISGEVVTYNAVTNAVTGLTQGVTYIIFTLDPYLDGGTRTYYAQTNVLSAQQAGEGAIVVGNVTIPTSGTGSGGGPGTGNPGDWCVDFDAVLPDGRLVRDLKPGDLVPCIDVRLPRAEVEAHAVRAISIGEEECYRLVTESGATIVQSASTPMDIPDGRVKRTTHMLGQQVLVHRDGHMTLELVCDLQFVGIRQVVKVDLGNRMFLAGEVAGIAIATHNAQYKP